MSNSLGLISAASINESTQLTLNEAKSTAQQYLSQIAASKDFAIKFAIAFGDSFDAATVEGLRQEWLAGDFDSLPAIEIRSTAEINGANGAFSADTNTIYLSREYIEQNGSHVGAIADVLLEEIGHSVDSRINVLDAPGDEGAIFSALARGSQLDEATLQGLKAEDDTATVILDEKIVVIEQAASTYKFDIVAKTGGGFQSLGDNPSINDRGLVAFVGTTPNDVDIYTGNPDGSLTDVTGALRSASNTTRSVQINNLNQIVTQDFRLSGGSAISAIRVWDANNPGDFRNVAANVSNNFQLLSQPSINNKVTAGVDSSFINNVVFSARLGTSGLLRTPQELPNLVTGGVYNEKVLTTPVRPMISDDDIVGGVVVRFGNTTSSPIFLYKNDLSSFQTIANVNMGFTNLGQSPGISDDGQVVTFYGDLSAAGAITLGLNPGAGIFASVNTTKGRVIQRIAGVSGNGFLDPGETFTDTNGNGNFDTGETDIGLFASFGKDSRVASNYNLIDEKGLGTITYLALDQAGNEGLYTSSLSTSISASSGGFSSKPGVTTLVAKVGDTIPGMDGTIQNLEIYDPINQAGQIAFWASFSDGKSAVIRANPPVLKDEVDLKVTATSNQDVIGIGPELTYTFTVANKGTVDATGVNLTITIPKGLNFISSSFTPISTTTDSAGNTVLTIDAGSIQKGEAFTAEATVEVTGFSQPLDKLRDYLWDINVSASAEANQSESNTTNNSASKTVQVDSSLGLAEDLIQEFLLGSSSSSSKSVQATSLSVTDGQGMTLRSAAAQETGDGGFKGIVKDGVNQFVDEYQSLGNKSIQGFSETIRTQVEEVNKFRDHAEQVNADPKKAADYSKLENFISSFDNSRKAIEQRTDETLDEANKIPVQVAQSMGEKFIDYALRAAEVNPIVAGFLERFSIGLPEGFSYNKDKGVASYEYTSPSEGVNFNVGVKVGKIEDYSEAGLAAIRQGNLTLFTQEAQNNAKNSTANAVLSLQRANTTLSATSAYDNSTQTGTAGLNSEYRSNVFNPDPNIKDTKFGVSLFGQRQFRPGEKTLWGVNVTIGTAVGQPNNQRLQLNSFDSELSAAPLGAMNLTTDSAQATTTERVSVATDGTQGNSFSSSAIVSGDGHFLAFNSAASSLVTGDTNEVLDVFVRNLQTNTTERVNIANDGSQANGESEVYAISADGSFVVFASDASNLVAGDTNGVRDIFVRDRQTGSTQRVSTANDGSQANGVSDLGAVSADGRYVVFSSIASNLVAGDTNTMVDVFVHDLQTGTTELISVANDSTQSNNDSLSPNAAISADGRYVVFYSYASNLVANDTNDAADIFVRDRQTGTTKRISIGTNGTEANDTSLSPSISADGRYIVFSSLASNLVAGDTNETGDIFVYDQQSGSIERVSLASNETEADSNSSRPAISADGRYVVFQSRASNLGVDNPDFWSNIYLRDRQTGETKLISLAPGTTTDGDSTDPFISGDGSRIAFESDATNLSAGDTNGVRDIFLWGTPSPTTAIGPDFNGDGQTDILWHHQTTGQNAVWLMNGTNLTAGVLIEPAVTDLNWSIGGTGDFNNDGKADILWRNGAMGENAVWLMNGTDLAQGVYLTPVADLNWGIGGTGDFNNDGKADILWRNGATGENAVWLMNGTDLAQGVYLTPVGDLNWSIGGTGDFNNDGKADILWRNGATGENVVWFMNGTDLAQGVYLTPVADLNWGIGGTGDFNNDGQADILWRNGATGENVVWLMNGTDLAQGAYLTPVGDLNWQMVV